MFPSCRALAAIFSSLIKRDRARLLAIGAATCLLLVPAVASAEVEYPDLEPEAADWGDFQHPRSDPIQPVIDDGNGTAGGTRRLLRFNGYLRNSGEGPLELTGSSPFGPLDNRLMGVRSQVIYNDPDDGDDGCIGPGIGSGGVGDDSCTAAWAGPGDAQPAVPSSAELRFETNDNHRHWHFMQAARHTLYDQTRSAPVGPAQKVGFCLVDSERTGGAGPPSRPDMRAYKGADNCQHDDLANPSDGPAAERVTMGISADWKDIYSQDLAFQWVDVSAVQPGSYWLLSQVDPLDVIAEDNARDTAERNNGGRWAPALIPGYVARDVSGGRTSPGSSTALSLSSTRFGNPGSVEYRIVDAPKQGTLSRPTNEWFDGSQVVYTPNAGYRGADSFRFEARDESQPAFPTSPAAAVATVLVGDAGDPDGPTLVQISGAPRRLGVGASAQLHAIVKSYHSPQVTWRATAGRINQSGLYRAPRRVPSSGSVRVSATAGDGTESHVTIRIVKKKRVSAPDLPTPGGRGPLSRLAVGKYGRLMVVKFVARRRGRVRVAVTHKGRKVASCTVRAPKRVAVTCRMRLPRRLATTRKGRLTVRAALEVQGRVVATRRTRVSLAATKVVSIRANSSALHVAHERHHHHD